MKQQDALELPINLGSCEFCGRDAATTVALGLSSKRATTLACRRCETVRHMAEHGHNDATDTWNALKRQRAARKRLTLLPEPEPQATELQALRNIWPLLSPAGKQTATRAAASLPQEGQ